MNFIVALFTDTSTELMSGAKSREWVHHNSTNQPTNQHGVQQNTWRKCLVKEMSTVQIVRL